VVNRLGPRGESEEERAASFKAYHLINKGELKTEEKCGALGGKSRLGFNTPATA